MCTTVLIQREMKLLIIIIIIIIVMIIIIIIIVIKGFIPTIAMTNARLP